MKIEKILNNKETREKVFELGKELVKQTVKTIGIGAAARASNAIIKRSKATKVESKKIKQDAMVIEIDFKKMLKSIVKETKECFVVGGAARLGLVAGKYLKDVTMKNNDSLIMSVRKTKYYIDEFENEDE